MDDTSDEESADEALQFRRSKSARDLCSNRSNRHPSDDGARVSFKKHIQVTTIDPIKDIPAEIRSRIWMSRAEMAMSMQEAALADWVETRAKQSDEFARLFPMEDEEEDEHGHDFLLGGARGNTSARPMGVC